MCDVERTDSDPESQSTTGNSVEPTGRPSANRDEIPLWGRACLWAGLAIVAFAVLLIVGRVLLESLDLVPPEAELPLGRLDTIAVDKEGNIYCYSQFTDRIQIYGPDSHFVRGFYVDTSTFRIDANQNVRTSRGSTIFSDAKLCTYNREGKLLREESYVRQIHDKEFAGDRTEAKDTAGNLYRIMPFATISSRVERITPDGKRTVVMSQPVYLRVIQVPFPALLYGFLGCCLVWTYAIAKHFHNKRRQQEQARR